MIFADLLPIDLCLAALGPTAILLLAVLGVGVLVAVVGGVVTAVYNAKHGRPNAFAQRLNDGIERMRSVNGVASQPAEAEDAQSTEQPENAAAEGVPAEDIALAQPAECATEEAPVAEAQPVEGDVQPEESAPAIEVAEAQPTEEDTQPEEAAPATDTTATPAAAEAQPDVVRPASMAPYVPTDSMRAASANLDFEDAVAREVADIEMPYDNLVDEILSRMSSGDFDDLDEFDFEGDFNDFADNTVGDTEAIAQLTAMAQQEEQEAGAEEAEDAEAEVEDDDLDGDWDVELTPAQGPMVQSPYRRTFRAKLIQSTPEVKAYYSALYNELMGYDKMRVNADLNAFALGRRTYVRMAIAGKTLCVYLSLDPKAFDPAIFHHRDKSGVRKFAQTPMMMRVRSNLSLRRTLSLILYMAGRNTRFQKRLDYQDADLTQALAYRTDEELLALGLIKSNMAAEEVDPAITPEDLAAHEAYMATVREYVDLRPIKPSQVGNLTVGDVDKMRAKINMDAIRRNPNASTTGKFAVDVQNGQYRYLLYAPSGDVLYASKMYATSQAVDRAVDTFREMIKKATPYTLYCSEGKFYCSIRYSNQVYKFPDYATKVLALQNQELVTETVKTAVFES